MCKGCKGPEGICYLCTHNLQRAIAETQFEAHRRDRLRSPAPSPMTKIDSTKTVITEEDLFGPPSEPDDPQLTPITPTGLKEDIHRADGDAPTKLSF